MTALKFNPDSLDWKKSGELVPAIVQDAATLQVLMLGFMNREALVKTLASGRVTFWSRSRKALWEKGETSGNTLRLISIDADCDNDALLILAEPVGPTCHRGTTSCFGDADAPGVGWLARLEKIIEEKRGQDPAKSYTAKLFSEGIERIAQKVGEEGVETALAGATASEKLPEEAADLLYHLLVLLRAREIRLEQVADVLRARHPVR